MKLDTTPETLRAIAAVLQKAAFLDDRIGQPDKARIAAWAEQIQRFKFGEADMLDGLQLYYDRPTDRAIGIGDLIECASQARRDRVAREDRAATEARQEALSAKAAEDLEALAERKGIPTPHAGPSFRRGVGQTPKAITCPWCNAKPAAGCVEPNSGKPLKRSPFHPARVEAWNSRNPGAQYKPTAPLADENRLR